MKTKRIHIFFVISFLTVIISYRYCYSQKSGNKTVQSIDQNKNRSYTGMDNNPIFQSLPANFDYNGVQCILQDHKGYMWFGTVDGLIRYDGIHMYLYENDPDDSSSLSYNAVNTIVEDKFNRLWIGTSRGLNLYNREKDNFIRVGNLNSNLSRLNGNYITNLCAEENSRIWVATFGDGVNVYNPENGTVRHYSYNADSSNSISSNRITAIKIKDSNEVWLGTQNGLNILSVKDGKYRNFYREEGNIKSLSNNNISALTFDHEGNLWVGTKGGGLNKLIKNNGDYLFERYSSNTKPNNLSNNFVLSLVADTRGYLWIGTENGGLNRLNIKSGSIEVFQVEEGNNYSISSNSIWSLYCDNEERIWIGTSNKGINVIDKKFSKFESYQKNIFDRTGLTDDDVTGFAEDSEGNVWIATDGGGICKFNPATRQINHIVTSTSGNQTLVNNAIQCILCDQADDLWIGTWAGGIDRLNKSGKRIRNYKLENEQGAGNNNIFTMYSDSKGRIWAGTAGSGLFRYDEKKDKFIQLLCDTPSTVLNQLSYVSSLLEDSDSTFWIGTLNGLVYLYEKSNGDFDCRNITFSEENTSISSNMINVVFKDSRNRIWIGTADNGLCLFNGFDESPIIYQKKNGLPSNVIHGILEDDKGFLWITTNKGLSRFNIDSLSFKNYTREDGLNSNEFYIRSCLKTKNGEFYLGGEKGFNTFYPENIKNNTIIPPVYLTNFKINNVTAIIGAKNSPLKKCISETEEITLNYKQTSFTIEFIALNYTRSTRNQFSYKLEGFDEKWKYVGNNRSASYTNIKPGKYVFMVKGSNNDGIWNNTPTRLIINITPPFWKTWWAIMIYVLLISTIIGVLLKIWNERIKIKHQLKLEQLGREKEHELNEMNIQFFTNISHEFRTPLSLIIAPLESIIPTTSSKIKEQLVVIYRNAQRLLHLTNNLMDFRKLEEGITGLKVKYGDITSFVTEVSSYFNVNSKRRNITYTIESDKTDINGWFDPDKAETILLNLLSNAFKFTPDNGKIRIVIKVVSSEYVKETFEHNTENIRTENQFIEIAVIDNGTGIMSEDLPFVFEKFYQSKSARNKKRYGTGIGLALTKGLVELHHGFIKVESIPNYETSFTLVLPVNREAFTEDELISESTNILNRTIIYDSENNKDKKELTESDQNEERPDILIVEDNNELRNFLAKELGKEFNVMQAENGKAGIDLALKNIPDLIVSDIVMPQYSGTDLCKVIKTDIRTCHIPVILLTAKTTISDQIEGAETGADAYITKPFNLNLLFAKINQLIKSRRKLYAHFSQDVYIMPNKLTDNEMDQMFLQKTIDYIVQNIADNGLNVESLAVAMNLSRSNVYRKIKALTGKTIIEFIRMIRLKQAIKLMETKKHTLAEIAYMTGFTSPSYFTKSFRDQYGKPPSEYLN